MSRPELTRIDTWPIRTVRKVPRAEYLEPRLPDLCRRLVDQLDSQTLSELLGLVHALARGSDGHPVESWLAAMFNLLQLHGRSHRPGEAEPGSGT
jgi:hypothetical protein